MIQALWRRIAGSGEPRDSRAGKTRPGVLSAAEGHGVFLALPEAAQRLVREATKIGQTVEFRADGGFSIADDRNHTLERYDAKGNPLDDIRSTRPEPPVYS